MVLPQLPVAVELVLLLAVQVLPTLCLYMQLYHWKYRADYYPKLQAIQ